MYKLDLSLQFEGAPERKFRDLKKWLQEHGYKLVGEISLTKRRPRSKHQKWSDHENNNTRRDEP